jgi:DNA gyrase subunit A
VVLPAKVPNLLLNGQIGIAVGMATNIPPHNLGELVDATIELIDNEDVTIDDLLKHVKGPDFPTGATIYGGAPMKQAYQTGRGSVMMRAIATIEETKRGRHQIVVTEIPYGVNKATLIEKVAELVKDKKLNGISDLRDETARGAVRVVIELKKDAYPKKLLNQLYKLTAVREASSEGCSPSYRV